MRCYVKITDGDSVTWAEAGFYSPASPFELTEVWGLQSRWQLQLMVLWPRTHHAPSQVWVASSCPPRPPHRSLFCLFVVFRCASWLSGSRSANQRSSSRDQASAKSQPLDLRGILEKGFYKKVSYLLIQVGRGCAVLSNGKNMGFGHNLTWSPRAQLSSLRQVT